MSGVGEMIASAVVKQVFGKFGGLATDEVALQWKFKDEVVKLADKMEDLEAVMLDADERLRRGGTDGKAVGRWLTKVKSVACDAEDVLDELDANELIKKVQPKLSSLFSKNNPLYQRITIPHTIKSVRKKIEETQRDGQILVLVRREAKEEGSRKKDTFVAIGNTSIKIGMVGRHIERRKFIHLLKNEAREDISIIPIVGLGGVGKSTLVESVLGDDSVNVFDIQAWVHVSENFNLHKIGSIILKRINRNINLDGFDLQLIHDCLKEELASIKYLIVLDDLWEDDIEKLEKLKKMLQYGRKGSKIIVTTRDRSVVQTLSTGFLAQEGKIRPVPHSDQIFLDILLPGECWDLIKQRAFGPGDDDDEMAVMADIGKQIAEKCGGLPLVANSLGKIMFDLKNVTSWENIRDSKINLGFGEEHQKKTLENLMLSYYYMKKEFKMCFTYLAVFPKGFVMDGYRLIQQWIALGYIGAEDDGQRCINYLLGMSFLQISKSSFVHPGRVEPKVPRELNMHDLVHDLVSKIAASEVLVLDANSTQPRTWNRARYCRHAQLIKYKNQPEVFKYLPTKVRSLHLRDSGKLQLPRKAFSRCKYIRVLDLTGTLVQGQSDASNLDVGTDSVEGQCSSSNIVLPSSIHQSKLLRYLDATALPITSLPKSFHTLQYMQTLILSKCSLEALPDSICTLQKLCYLDLSYNIRLNKLPVSLGNLNKLYFLNLLGCSLLQDLPDSISELTYLRHLDISQCHAIQNLPHNFGQLPHLIFLNLSGCLKLIKLPDSVNLKSLVHLDLSSCHELEELPKDFGNLKNLVFLNFSDCYKVSVLPESFCQLVHLKDLDLSDCHGLKELPEFFGNLSKLESLNLTSCSKLQVLPESFCELFRVRHLNLSYCMRLEKLPSSLGDLNLEFLDISATKLIDLPDSIRGMTTLTQLVVSTAGESVFDKACDIRKHLNLPERIIHSVHQIDNKGCSSIVELAQLTCQELQVLQLDNVRHPEDAERAKLRDKSDLRLLGLVWRFRGKEDKSVLERLIPPRTLEHFVLAGYMSKDFPNWMSHMFTYLPSLTFLGLFNLGTCDNLPPFGQLPNLRTLCMENIPNITKIGKEFYGEGGTCWKLRSIQLESMKNLVEWWTTPSGEENEEFLIPNLHNLETRDCPKLKFLPYPPRSMFWNLDNSSMVLPNGGFGKLASSTFPFQMVIRNYNVAPDNWDRFQYLPTLEIFEVGSISGLRMLPDVFRCFNSLTKLYLFSLWDLETLPEWLGHLTCLQDIAIKDCPNLTGFPESMKKLKALRELWLEECNGLYQLPEWFGELISLQELCIISCPYFTFLPKSMKKLTALRLLSLKECEALVELPEWLGELISLQELNIVSCPKPSRLPGSIRNLRALKKLYIWGCPSLVKRCQGKDAHKISHIPTVTLNYVPSLAPRSLRDEVEVMDAKWKAEAKKQIQITKSDSCSDLEQCSESEDDASSSYGNDDDGEWPYGYAGASTSGYARA